tara:strand:+ start:7493 stop:8497 length:1005 start_codon:yes stop_codon:yes gene_type:complete
MKNWYQIENKGKEIADIYLYSEIGGMEINAENFVKDLSDLKGKDLNVHINSLGGSVFDGIAIYNALKNFKGKVTTKVEGIGASIASVIALAGDSIEMADNSLLMIHNPYAMVGGDSQEMRKTAELLDKIKNEIIGIYESKTGLTSEVLNSMMDEETWFNSSEALESNFIDSVSESVDVKNEYDLSEFKNITNEKVNQILIKNHLGPMEELKKMLNDIKSLVGSLANPKSEENVENKVEEIVVLDNEEVVNKITALENAIADFEGVKVTMENEIEDLKNNNSNLQGELDKAKAKSEAKKVDAVASSDPAPVTSEKAEDPNQKFFDHMVNVLKNKY